MGSAKERRWYGDVTPWSDEQLEQYCRDMGFPPKSSEADFPENNSKPHGRATTSLMPEDPKIYADLTVAVGIEGSFARPVLDVPEGCPIALKP